MIRVGNILVSEDIADNEFVCNLDKCKGACCVEGELGAPLEEEELEILKYVYEEVKPFLTPEGIKAIEEQGLFILDEDGDYSTPTIGGRECAYAVYDERGVLQCGIERACNAGKINWRKPISCHLYPIRILKKRNLEALNYHRWEICSPACELGKQLKVPVYRFLKDALIRKYGESWYAELVRQIETSAELRAERY